MWNINRYDEDKSRLVIQVSAIDLEGILFDIIHREIRNLEEKLLTTPELVGRQDAAQILGVVPNTISSMIKRGDLINRSTGRKVMVLKSDLLKVRKNKYTRY